MLHLIPTSSLLTLPDLPRFKGWLSLRPRYRVPLPLASENTALCPLSTFARKIFSKFILVCPNGMRGLSLSFSSPVIRNKSFNSRTHAVQFRAAGRCQCTDVMGCHVQEEVLKYHYCVLLAFPLWLFYHACSDEVGYLVASCLCRICQGSQCSPQPTSASNLNLIPNNLIIQFCWKQNTTHVSYISF